MANYSMHERMTGKRKTFEERGMKGSEEKGQNRQNRSVNRVLLKGTDGVNFEIY
jgi:hypothetical protein